MCHHVFVSRTPNIWADTIEAIWNVAKRCKCIERGASDLQKANITLKKQVQHKDSVINDYENWLHDTMKSNEFFRNHNVRLQSMTNALKSRYYQLLINCDIKLWNTQDIVIWIVNLNQDEYKRYGAMLLRNMTDEGINGSSLQNLCMNDLHRFGIREVEAHL